jgi:malonate transporter
VSPLLLFPDFAIIALGFLLRRFWMPASAWVTIERLVYFVLFPCLLFHSVVASDFSIQSVGAFALGAPLILFLCFVVGWLGLAISQLNRVDFASGLQIAYRFNSYIGLALASRLAGQAAVANMAILLAIAVPLANILAVGSMSKDKSLGALAEIVKNPLIVGTVLGVAVKLIGLPVPDPIMLTLGRLSQAAVALGLMAVGSGLVFSGLKGNWAVSVWFLGLKLVAAPILAVTYASWMDLPTMQAQVLLIFAALPSASSAYILATRMGGNGALVACLISLSTVLATLTIPLAFTLAKH